MAERQPVLDTLQAGRAIAALAVVLHHALGTVQLTIGPVPEPVAGIFWYGYLGVDFFFVLSGFIIVHAHFDDPMGAEPASRYARKRLSRIYIPYLPASIAMMALYLFIHRNSDKEILWSAFTSLTLIASEKPPALAVAWTLVHEMTFYAVFLASFFLRPFWPVVAAWVAAILAAWLTGTAFSAPPIAVLFAPINLEFVGGMLAAVAVRRLSARWAPLFLAIGLAGIATFFLLNDLANQVDVVGKRAWFGLSLAPLVAAMVWLERTGRLRSPAWLTLLGDASYAIYLAHVPVMLAIGRGSARLVGPDQWALVIGLCILAGVASGVAYHLSFEKPALALFRRGLTRGSRVSVT